MPRLSVYSGLASRKKRLKSKNAFKLTKEQKDQRKLARTEKVTAFISDITDAKEALDTTIENIATKHKRSKDYVRTYFGMMGGEGTKKRAVTAKNAFTSIRMAEVNADLPPDKKFTMAAFLADPETKKEYQELTKDQKEDYRKQYIEAHAQDRAILKKVGKAELADVNETIDFITGVAHRLSQRSNHHVIIIASRNSFESYAKPSIYVSKTAEQFFENTFKKSAHSVAQHLEAWGLDRTHGAAVTSRAEYSAIKTAVVTYLQYSLDTASGVTDAQVNYANFFWKTLKRFRVKLVGWPEDIPIGGPSSLRQEQVHRLHSLTISNPPQIKYEAVSKDELKIMIEEQKEKERRGEVTPPPTRKTTGKRKTPASDLAEEEFPAASRRRTAAESQSDDGATASSSGNSTAVSSASSSPQAGVAATLP